MCHILTAVLCERAVAKSLLMLPDPMSYRSHWSNSPPTLQFWTIIKDVQSKTLHGVKYTSLHSSLLDICSHPSVLAGKWKGGNEVGQANAEGSTQIKDSLPHLTFIQYINTSTPKESSFVANFRCEVWRRRSFVNWSPWYGEVFLLFEAPFVRKRKVPYIKMFFYSNLQRCRDYRD